MVKKFTAVDIFSGLSDLFYCENDICISDTSHCMSKILIIDRLKNSVTFF